MASVDNLSEAREAWSRGWATFRVCPVGRLDTTQDEVVCPADPASGLTCASCPVPCDARTTHVVKGRVIEAHGNRKGLVV